jgi:hypothetical protein
VKALDIITNAMFEINMLEAGETPSSEDAAFCLSKLNRLFDNWNTESLFIYGTLLAQFTLTPNKNPHTIGLAATSPDFTVTTARPPKILQASLVLTDQSPNLFRDLHIVDDAWWTSNPFPTLATQIPYYLWPNYSWPQGNLFLWPVPTTAYDIRLDLWTLFSSMALTDVFTLPPGYEDAITLSLAESLIAPFKADASPSLIQAAMQARARIKSLNSEAPVMGCDPAVQSVDSVPKASIANFYSGFFR